MAAQHRRLIRSRRGLTLVELMVVVTIIAILAAIASIASGRYVKSAKVEKLRAIALEVASGQERYRSRNNVYYPATPGQVTYSDSTKGAFKNLLDFGRTVQEDIIIDVESWTNTTCTKICDTSTPPPTGSMGFAVRVQQDLTPGGEKSTVIVTNLTEAPVLTNEGQ